MYHPHHVSNESHASGSSRSSLADLRHVVFCLDAVVSSLVSSIDWYPMHTTFQYFLNGEFMDTNLSQHEKCQQNLLDYYTAYSF